MVLPVEKVAVVPLIKDAKPLPAEGWVLPVEGLPSGVALLKLHWAMISPESGQGQRQNANASNKHPFMIVIAGFA